MSQSQEIVIKPHEDIVLVVLECSQIEETLARDMQADVPAAAEQASHLPVVLDMSNVEIITSVSIGTLVMLLQTFNRQDRRFILVGLQEQVRETLTICQLSKLFEIHDDVDDAVAHIRESS